MSATSFAVALEVARLALVVGLQVQLALRLGGRVRIMSSGREEVESSQQAAEVVTSLSTLRATPGNWTLSASSRPPCVRARWIWPIDAAATGSKSKRANLPSQPLPYSRPSTRRSCVSGIE